MITTNSGHLKLEIDRCKTRVKISSKYLQCKTRVKISSKYLQSFQEETKTCSRKGARGTKHPWETMPQALQHVEKKKHGIAKWIPFTSFGCTPVYWFYYTTSQNNKVFFASSGRETENKKRSRTVKF